MVSVLQHRIDYSHGMDVIVDLWHLLAQKHMRNCSITIKIKVKMAWLLAWGLIIKINSKKKVKDQVVVLMWPMTLLF